MAAGKNGGGMVIARTGARRVQTIVPNQREWLSVLACINAAGKAIPSFYIFRGRRFRQNYIQLCEPGATMAMQQRAWMTTYLFSAWISHFIASIQQTYGISPTLRHLLILDGHNSHCTLEVVRAAKNVGLDLITLPSHTSHALQPLDVAVFKPFKQFFREYRDFWMSRNINQPAGKETLAHWVSLSLRKALTEANIQAGFRGAGIYPLNRHAVDRYLVPSDTYGQEEGGGDNANSNVQQEGLAGVTEIDEEGAGFTEPIAATEGCNEHEMEEEGVVSAEPAGDAARDLAADLDCIPDTQTEHFFVNVDYSDPTADSDVAGLDPEVTEPNSITRFLQLPTFAPRASTRRRDPIVDFAKSIILTCDAYEQAELGVRTRRENAAAEKERQKIEREESRKRKAAEREENNARKAAEREESLRIKEQRAQEKAAAQALKAAEKEAAAQAKAARAYECAIARAARGALRGRGGRASSVSGRASRAPESVDGHQVALETGSSQAQEHAAFGHHHFNPPAPQFGPFMQPLHPNPFSLPPGAATLPSHFFFPSASTLPPLSHFDTRPYSTVPTAQLPHAFPVAPTPTRANPTSRFTQGEGGRSGEL